MIESATTSPTGGFFEVPLTLVEFCMELASCEGGDDDTLSDAAESCGSGPAGPGEITAICSCNAFDDADVAQPAELATDFVRGQLVEKGEEIGTTNAGDIGTRVLQGVQKGAVGRIEEVDALDGLVLDDARLCEV